MIRYLCGSCESVLSVCGPGNFNIPTKQDIVDMCRGECPDCGEEIGIVDHEAVIA